MLALIGSNRWEDVGSTSSRRTLPISIEVARHLGDNRTNREHIEVDEHHVVAGAKVFVADVASPDDRDLSISRERLVMHSPVEAGKVRQVIDPSPSAMLERVEQPYLDVRVRVQRRERRVETSRVVVIEQEPDAHTTIGRATQRVEEQTPREIVMPDVVLHVERLLGRLGKMIASAECISAVAERYDARPPRMCRDEWQHGLGEPRFRGVARERTVIDDWCLHNG